MPETTRTWYYAVGRDVRGPTPQGELETMLLDGELSRGTLVWSHPMTGWHRADEVTALREATDPPPPPLPAEDVTPPPLAEWIEAAEREHEARQVAEADSGRAGSIPSVPPAWPESAPSTSWDTTPRPWRRYFARLLDVTLFAVILAFAVALTATLGAGTAGNQAAVHFLGDYSALFGFGALFLWVPVEATLLATWHTTPGKWMAGLRVVRHESSSWSYQDALHRAGAVLLRGLGLGLPLVSLVTLIVGYNKLEKNGRASWDIDHDFDVAEVGMSGGRWIALLGALGGLVWVYAQ